MTDFKLGDKIKLAVDVGPIKFYYKFGVEVGDVLTVVDNREPASGFFLGNGEVYINWANEHKDYFEMIKEFDLKKDKWFIRTPTPEISKTVQQWLFEQGVTWQDEGKKIKYTTQKFLTNTQYPSTPREYIMYSNTIDNYADKNELKEIKLTFKTVVDSVEYPVVETEQEIKIRELKETIEKAQKQIDQIINNKD